MLLTWSGVVKNYRARSQRHDNYNLSKVVT